MLQLRERIHTNLIIVAAILFCNGHGNKNKLLTLLEACSDCLYSPAPGPSDLMFISDILPLSGLSNFCNSETSKHFDVRQHTSEFEKNARL